MAYITDLDVSINVDEENKLRSEGFQKMHSNLNEGVPGANSIFLWFKKGDRAAITRVQVSFNEEMAVGLKGYQKIPNNLNTGTTGKPLYMWFSKTTKEYDVPITDIAVTVDPNSEAAHLTASGMWEEVSCDLNLGAGGKFVHAWVKRENPIYICDVTATDTYDQDESMFCKGYTRVDVNTNMGTKGGAEVFIWYRKTIKKDFGLFNLNISTNQAQATDLEKKGFKKVPVNLNEKADGKDVYLWYKTDPDLSRVQGLVLLRNANAVVVYKKEGVTVVERNLNTGTPGDILYMCFV